MTQPASSSRGAPRRRAPARRTPAPRRTPTRAPAPKPSARAVAETERASVTPMRSLARHVARGDRARRAVRGRRTVTVGVAVAVRHRRRRRASLETPEYRIETDDIARKGNGDFTMPHKVAFSRPGSDGTADRAEGNDKRGTVSLFGNVVMHDNGNAPEAGSQDEYAKGGPSTLTCDQLDVDSKSKIYTAIGHVHFTQGARDMVADHGVLNRKTGMLRLDGHVKTKENESTMTAQNLEYNLEHQARRRQRQADHHQAASPDPGARLRHTIAKAKEAQNPVLMALRPGCAPPTRCVGPRPTSQRQSGEHDALCSVHHRLAHDRAV